MSIPCLSIGPICGDTVVSKPNGRPNVARDRGAHRERRAGVAAAAAFVLAWLNPAAAWYYVIFALLGASIGATIVSGTLISMEFSAPEQRPTYMGIANTTVGLSGAFAPLLGAGLARITSYDWMFFASAILSLVAVVALHWLVHDPRWKQTPVSSD